MVVDAANIKQRMEASSELQATHVEVEDISGGCGSSFSILVVSAAFEGVRLLERHRMLHAVLGDDMDTIHAVKLKCFTPAKYAEHTCGRTEE